MSNSGDPNQTPRSAASDLDLCSLPMSHKKDARLIWVNLNIFLFGYIITFLVKWNNFRYPQCTFYASLRF